MVAGFPAYDFTNPGSGSLQSLPHKEECSRIRDIRLGIGVKV
jgi:hypothetical protein